MSKLIALVATAVIVNGERTVIQPGQPLPELNEHDAKALQASGAASDPAKVAAAEADEQKAYVDGIKAFEATREAVVAQQQSTETADPPESAIKPAAKPGKK